MTTFSPTSQQRRYWITLFTKAPVGSVRALIEGVISSIVFGWVIAIVMVPTYNRIVGDR
jgi:hypothetical protein